MREFIVHLLIGLAVAGGGLFMVFNTTFMLDFFGPVDWAEQKLGSSSMFYKLLGVLVVFIGLIVAFDLWDAFLHATLGQIFPGGAK